MKWGCICGYNLSAYLCLIQSPRVTVGLIVLVRFRRRRRRFANTFQLYGCRKNCHPSRWPWGKVTKLPKQDTIYLVPTIKLEPLILLGMSQLDATLTRVPFTCHYDLWPWILKVKWYLGNGRPDCHGTKWTEVDRMPWCETLRKWVNRMLCWLGYLWLWPLTLNFHGQITSREWEAWLSRKGRE